MTKWVEMGVRGEGCNGNERRTSGACRSRGERGERREEEMMWTGQSGKQ